MKLIIAGSRTIHDYKLVEEFVDKLPFKPTEIVSGRADGVDKLGERYAIQHRIKIAKFPADWTKYGKAAGFIRNEEMALYGDALIAFVRYDKGKGTNGTLNMIEMAKKHNLKIYTCSVDISFGEFPYE